jgi:hypothetical protein
MLTIYMLTIPMLGERAGALALLLEPPVIAEVVIDGE